MRLLALHLTQFRNYSSLALDLSSERFSVFVGPNASGKTNLLESLWLLARGSPAASLEEEDLVQHGTDFYRIRAQVHADGVTGPESLETVTQLLPRRQKAFFHNDVKVPRAEMLGRMPSVLFLPQDLELFTGPPAERRRFLDDTLTQVSPAYGRSLAEYQRVLKQRNALLRRIADRQAKPSDLEPWDRAVGEKGAAVTVARLELVETFRMALEEELHRLGEAWRDVSMRYDRAGEARDVRDLSQQIFHALQKHHDRDIAMLATSIGPHRDDWRIEAEARSIERFASRGQQRSAVLALLFLRASFLELRRSERPLILLDDIFSELDDRHRGCVMEAFPDHQVLLTSTHEPPVLPDGAHVWHVGEGGIMA